MLILLAVTIYGHKLDVGFSKIVLTSMSFVILDS